jgi:ribose-phosphate pyrophosphokinase
VGANLVELLLLIDACRRADAGRVTAVVPYLCYARQDRRSWSGEALGGRVVADAVVGAGADRVVVVDPHSPAVEATFGLPVETVSAVAVLAGAAASAGLENGVVVAPDLGAAKLARRYAERLGLPVAVVQKRRVSGEAVRVDDLAGDVAGRTPLVVDDMISTGGTIEAAVDALAARGAVSEVIVAATHALLVGPAIGRLERLPIRRLLVTDTVAVPPAPGVPIETHSVAAVIAGAVARLHQGTAPEDPLAQRRED